MGGGARISVRQPAELGDRAGQFQDALVVNLVQHEIPVLPKAARGAWVKPQVDCLGPLIDYIWRGCRGRGGRKSFGSPAGEPCRLGMRRLVARWVVFSGRACDATPGDTPGARPSRGTGRTERTSWTPSSRSCP